MISLSRDERQRWRVELEQARAFRDERFGMYQRAGQRTTGVGENLLYYANGTSVKETHARRPFNLAYIFVKNIVPLLAPNNPQVLSLPAQKEQAEAAPLAGHLVNHFRRTCRSTEVDQQCVFDAWLLGMGISKTGFATKYGLDLVPTKPEQKRQEKKRLFERAKDTVNSLLVEMGIKSEPENGEMEPPETPVEAAPTIRSEAPYERWVDPFNFCFDPRARSVEEASWVSETVRQTVAQVKATPQFNRLARSAIEAQPLERTDIPESQIEEFATCDVHYVQYRDDRSPTGVTNLILVENGGDWDVLYHDHSQYTFMQGWQYEVIAYNKSPHDAYPIAHLTQVRPLLDRINDTLDALLEQAEKFVSKVIYDKDKLDDAAKNALKENRIGATIGVTGAPNTAVYMLEMQQLKNDVRELLTQLIDMAILMVGMTRAELTGLTSAQTATEAQIGQSGSSNRRNQELEQTLTWMERRAEKLWAVIAEFVPVDDIELLTGESEVDQESGLPRYTWLPSLDPQAAQKLRYGQYRFRMEMTSVQRPNLEILRKQIENVALALTNPAIIQGLMQQGKRLDVAEGLRIWFKLFPELISDPSRLIRDLPPSPAATPGAPPGGSATPPGAGGGAQYEALRQAPAPNTADLASAAAGEKGMGAPLA